MSDTDWLSQAWWALSERQRHVVTSRARGATLQQIGTELGVSRERARQLKNQADEAITAAATTAHGRNLLSRLALIMGDSAATPARDIAAELPPAPTEARNALLQALGFRHPKTWDGDLTNWWTRQPDELDNRLATIVELAPLSDDDLRAALQELGLSYQPPIPALLASPNSKICKSALGWHRPARIGRDLAFLYLQSQGAPRAVADIAVAAGVSENAIRETMRREAVFAQMRPEGTWALTDWGLPGTDNRYSSAEETVIEVVRELGPISLNELKREVIARYPVSVWRITQCLSNHAIGLTAEGRYDLVERGAEQVEDAEPKRPATIEAKGDSVGVRLDVNHDMLRGSGLAVNRWLTWYLGLRTVPSVRIFSLESGGEVTIKRASSVSQISSLRAGAHTLDVVEGCKVALILNIKNDTAKLHHICASDACPA